jgi:hypothetical protein
MPLPIAERFLHFVDERCHLQALSMALEAGRIRENPGRWF